MKNEPKVPKSVHDEAYVEEKARELITMVANLYPYESNPCVIPKSKAKDFIRTIVKDCKPKVNREDIEYIIYIINDSFKAPEAKMSLLCEELEELGMKMDKGEYNG